MEGVAVTAATVVVVVVSALVMVLSSRPLCKKGKEKMEGKGSERKNTHHRQHTQEEKKELNAG